MTVTLEIKHHYFPFCHLLLSGSAPFWLLESTSPLSLANSGPIWFRTKACSGKLDGSVQSRWEGLDGNSVVFCQSHRDQNEGRGVCTLWVGFRNAEELYKLGSLCTSGSDGELSSQQSPVMEQLHSLGSGHVTSYPLKRLTHGKGQL